MEIGKLVSALIRCMNEHSPKAKVKVTWEGITREIDEESIYVTPCGTVLIDGDGNDYKKAFLSGKKKP